MCRPLAVVLLVLTFTAQGWALEIIGHRGASHDAPENTLASVKLAWEQSADAVEIDVFLSKDGRIVVIHDETTTRYGGPDRKVADQTLAELKSLDVGRWKDPKWTGERIPTLAEVVATIPKGKRLLIEIKCGPEIIPELSRVLKKSGKHPRQTAVIGFSYKTMTAVKQSLPAVAVYWIVELKQEKKTGIWSPGVGELIRKARAAGLDGLDLGHAPSVIDAGYVRRVKHAGLGLYVWTVNSAAEARRLRSSGVDGITTDRPGWLRASLSDEQARIGVEQWRGICQHNGGRGRFGVPATVSKTALEGAIP